MVRACSNDVAHTQSGPPSGELCAQLLGCNHILDAIMEFATQQTRGRCLAVNKRFFHFAGKALYRYLRVNGRNMSNVFKGALEGEPGFDIAAIKAECIRLRSVKGCLPARPCPDGFRDPEDSEYESEDEDVYEDQDKDDNSCDGNAALHKDDNSIKDDPAKEDGSQSGSTNRGRGRAPKRVKRERCTAGQLVKRRTKLRPSSLKAQLLAHVEVLTVAEHSHGQCHIYGPYGTDIFPNLEVLRIAPTPRGDFYTEVFCSQNECEEKGPRVVCPLVAWLNPRKIVLRNVDAREIPVRWDFQPSEWPAPRLEEVVYYLCPERHAYRNDGQGATVGKHFHHAKRFKIVWHMDWEGLPPNVEEDRPLSGTMTLTEVMYLTREFARRPGGTCVMYGLEKLEFVLDDVFDYMLRLLKKNFPHKELTNETIMEEICHRLATLSLIERGTSPSCERKTLQSKPEDIEYKTLEEYFDDFNSRHAEFNADD